MATSGEQCKKTKTSLTVNDLMSRNPKIINGKARLSEAEQLMRTNSIHSLIVVDEENRLAGIIDYFRTI